MRFISSTPLLFAALFLLLLPACNKSEKKTDGPGSNAWTVEDPSTGTNSPQYFSAAKIARLSNGTFRAIGSTPSDSIVFSFYGSKLPTVSGQYTSYSTSDSARNLSCAVYTGGARYQSKKPASVVGPVTVTVDKGKLHIVMPGQEAGDGSGKKVFIRADLQEP